MAQFFIQTDKQKYFAGETVNGLIYINVGTMIMNATGVSLKFSGYQCVKWLEYKQLHRPDPKRPRKPNQPPPYDPIAHIPPNQIFNSDNAFKISDCESEDNREYDHRPKYVKTSANRYFQMFYYQTRNGFTKNDMMVYNCSGFQPGQYSFPFSFKTFQGWPASLKHSQTTKKGIIIYNLTVAIQPRSPKFQLKYSRAITLCETRVVSEQKIERMNNISYCCCCIQGPCTLRIHFEKDGYTPGELVQMIIEVDNSQCKANISTISIMVINTVTMRSQGKSTVTTNTLLNKNINGVLANQTAIGNQAIRQSFLLQSSKQMKPSCTGKLLSSTYSLQVLLHHDLKCNCCSTKVSGGIPVIIFPVINKFQMANIFQQNWAPKKMPQTTIIIINNYNNFNPNQMSNQGGGQQPNFNQAINQNMNPNMNQNMNQGMNQNMNQGMNQNMNQNMNQGMNQNMNQGMNQNMNQNMNQGMNQNMNQGMNQNMNQGMNQNMNQNMNQGMNPNMIQVMNKGIGMNQGNIQNQQFTQMQMDY